MQILSDMFLILISNEVNTKRKLSLLPPVSAASRHRHCQSPLPVSVAHLRSLYPSPLLACLIYPTSIDNILPKLESVAIQVGEWIALILKRNRQSMRRGQKEINQPSTTKGMMSAINDSN